MRSLIKAYDFLDFAYNRSLMKFRFYLDNIKRAVVLGNNIKSILVIRLASIGDIVRSTAVISSLRKRYPKARIDFLTTNICIPLLKDNHELNEVYSLDDIKSLAKYDWVINLQAPDPPESFLKGSGMSFTEILAYISKNIPHRLISGRQIRHNKEISPTNIFYCTSAIEELFLTSLLNFPKNPFARFNLPVKKGIKKFKLKDNTVAIFLGSNSSGGDDGGFRTYSISFLARMIGMLYSRFNIVVIGQSGVKTKEEMKQFKAVLKLYPKVKNLVDKTSLEELVTIIRSSRLFISSDSSPLHIALAVKTPVIGLFPNHGSFEVSQKLSSGNYIIINSRSPCFRYSWRWKFFCTACSDKHSRLYRCNQKNKTHPVDTIPLENIESAVSKLLSL